jgi:ribA/ribD-fused uncharacterized protein
MSLIRFYKPTEAYGFLSNFYPINITINNVTYRSVEHYYQSEKFALSPNIRQRIISATTAKEAYVLAGTFSRYVDPKWNKRKEAVMIEALNHKFSSSEMVGLLLSTGDAELVEGTVGDSFWGEGPDGCGLNRMGTLLMRLRKKRKENVCLTNACK